MASGSTLPPQAYTRDVLSTAFTWLQTQPESIRKMASNPDALVGLYLRAQKFGGTSAESDAPVSSQSFVNDLKHIAEGLKQFETAPNAATNSGQGAPMASANLSFNTVAPIGTTHQSKPFAAQSTNPALQTSVAPKNYSAVQTPMSPVATTPHHLRIDESDAFHNNHHGAVSSGHRDIESAVESTLIRPLGIDRSSAAQSFSATHASAFIASAPGAGANPNIGALHPETLKLITQLRQDFHLSSDAEVINLAMAIAYKSLRNLLT